MTKDHDPIIDACLEEVLGGVKPPDVADSVLRTWSHRPDSAIASTTNPDPLLPPICDLPPIAVAISRRRDPFSSSLQKTNRRYSVVWIGASLAVVLVMTIMAVSDLMRRPAQRDVAQSSGQRPDPKSTAQAATKVDQQNHEQPLPKESPPISQQTPEPTKPNLDRNTGPTIPNSQPSPTRSVPAEQGPLKIDQLIAAAQLPDPMSDAAIVDRINAAVHSLWSQQQLSPPVPIADDSWRRRLFQVVLGRDPTDVDATRFGKVSTREQRQRLVTSLMSTEPYVEEFARRWSEFLTDVFLPADLLDGNPVANRDGMLQFFRRALLDQRPFDRVASDMLTATGSGVPGSSDYNGAANYLLARADGKWEHATADTSRLFLGRNVECQQCHDDTRQEQRRQSEFWQLNAFFRQIVVSRDRESKKPTLTDVDFHGEDKKDARNAIVFFEQPDGLLKSAFPAFSGQGQLPRSGLLAEVNRRELFARCVTTSPEFRRAVTNRLWSTVYGGGLAPVDDLSAADSESNTLLVELADQFAVHEFNPRHVITWAVLSEPFAIPSRDMTAMLSKPETAWLHRFAEQRPAPRRPVHENLLAMAKNFGQNSLNSATTAKVTTAKVEDVPLATSKNGKIIVDPPAAKPLFDAVPISANLAVRRILDNSRLSNQQKAQHLFQLVVHRQPRRRELDVVEKVLEKSGDRPDSAWNAIWSALHAAVP